MQKRSKRVAFGLVSIQLVSPTRGDFSHGVTKSQIREEFPFNWFPLREGTRLIHGVMEVCKLVSIQLVSPTRGDRMSRGGYLIATWGLSFHSTGFPYERGQCTMTNSSANSQTTVSIQLVSPTRGDLLKRSRQPPPLRPSLKFPFNWFPLREGTHQSLPLTQQRNITCVSIQLVSPTRGDR